jgi:enoyl reductase-like protein
LWKEFDESIFKLPKDKRTVWLKEPRAEVIQKLNRDFSKPWFGWKKDETVASYLGDMTYEEVVLRMIRLMFVAHEERWIDVSLRNLTGDWWKSALRGSTEAAANHRCYRASAPSTIPCRCGRVFLDVSFGDATTIGL